MESSPEEQGLSKLLLKLNYLVVKRGTADNPHGGLGTLKQKQHIHSHLRVEQQSQEQYL